MAAGVGRQLADGGIVLFLHSKILFITGYAGNPVLGDGNLTRGMQLVTSRLRWMSWQDGSERLS